MAKEKSITPEEYEAIRTKDFFDCISPATIKFYSDYYIVGDSYRCAWAVKEYPPSTEELAILSQLSDKSGVTLRIYSRLVEAIEMNKIMQNAMRKNSLKSASNDINDTVQADGNIPAIKELYELWYEKQEELRRMYSETLIPRVPLSENSEFKSIRNAVIKAAETLGGTYEKTDENTDNKSRQYYEPDYVALAVQDSSTMSAGFFRTSSVITPIILTRSI